MKRIINIAVILLSVILVACESSDDISNSLDHQVPECKSVSLVSNGQTVNIDDAIITKNLWGFVPTTNLQTVDLPTLTASKGSTVKLNVTISDNVALKTLEFAYSSWLVSKYINFSNPEGDIPKNPTSYAYTTEFVVPADAVSTPWIETFNYNDGSAIKITQPYHKMTLTIVDINMNKKIIPVYIKIQ